MERPLTLVAADGTETPDDGPDIEPSTVAEQKAFFAQWVASLRQKIG